MTTTVPSRATDDTRKPPAKRRITAVPGTGDRVFLGLTRTSGLVVLGIFAAIGVFLTIQAWPAIRTAKFSFLTTQAWEPDIHHFGIAGILPDTIFIALVAVVIAIPISLGLSLFISEVAPQHIKRVLVSLVDLMAAVPSVVYGLWGLIVLAPVFRSTVEPFLSSVLGWTGLFNGPSDGVGLLLAGVILFVMVLPTMVAISRDVLAVVPVEQVEGALALGATKWQVLRKVVVPGARTGILGGFTLAMGRALGETVAVALVIGNSPFIAHSVKAPAATLASLIVNNFGEATGTELAALFGAALVLLVIGISVNALARVLVKSTVRGGAASVAVA